MLKIRGLLHKILALTTLPWQIERFASGSTSLITAATSPIKLECNARYKSLKSKFHIVRTTLKLTYAHIIYIEI